MFLIWFSLHFEPKIFFKNHKFWLKITFWAKKGCFFIEQSNAKLRNLHFRKIQLFLHLDQKTVSWGKLRKKSYGDLKMFTFSKKKFGVIWGHSRSLKVSQLVIITLSCVKVICLKVTHFWNFLEILFRKIRKKMPKSDTFLGIWLYTKCVTFTHDSVRENRSLLPYLIVFKKLIIWP